MVRNTEKRKQRLSFDALGLQPDLLKTIESVGYVKPTPVQAGVIPLALEGHDLIGQARTGTGKTAAFVLPILQMLERNHADDIVPQALVLVPTRELAVQVQTEFEKLRGDMPFRCAAIYGGHSLRTQMNQLKAGLDVVVGTPGRVLDHLKRGTFRTSSVRWLVLDEADRMLDIGFRPDIIRIVKRCPVERQTLLLSATLPTPILDIAKRYMRRPKLINFSTKSLAAETIEQFYFSIAEEQKYSLLLKLLEREQPQQTIVFCRTKWGTQKLFRQLEKDFNADAVATIHGDMLQKQRDRTMKRFRDGETKILVATDVVGRGIDVSDISHIINFDIPQLSDDYVHRVGRTGRMGRQGIAYTFVTPVERNLLDAIEKRIGKPLIRDEIAGIESIEWLSSSGRSRYRRAL
ncbi:MAG TPA: DEAD/DEAH box helicase [Pirellulaceae bacterium]|nr:DEAD/DEAH box helicase [Pirellulaceae bacterium]HMO91187.1 DEAD/DEAH box helicase [Pirellulaceae bacterium]HMP69043.1 DEAD/DEAH box helicase [Pirellulaceae bacterium]